MRYGDITWTLQQSEVTFVKGNVNNSIRRKSFGKKGDHILDKIPVAPYSRALRGISNNMELRMNLSKTRLKMKKWERIWVVLFTRNNTV
jgi:hypothetical protein